MYRFLIFVLSWVLLLSSCQRQKQLEVNRPEGKGQLCLEGVYQNVSPTGKVIRWRGDYHQLILGEDGKSSYSLFARKSSFYDYSIAVDYKIEEGQLWLYMDSVMSMGYLSLNTTILKIEKGTPLAVFEEEDGDLNLIWAYSDMFGSKEMFCNIPPSRKTPVYEDSCVGEKSYVRFNKVMTQLGKSTGFEF